MTDSPAISRSTGVDLSWVPVTGGLPTAGQYYGVAFGDVNNDGKLDVAAQDGGMRVYIGDGAGNFADQSSGIGPSSDSTDIILADFNNDGGLDVAGARLCLGNGGRGGTMMWSLNNKPGSWWAVTAADVNLDGKTDIVAGTQNGVKVWTGNGSAGGNLLWVDSSNGLPTSEFWGVDVGDINHDGKPDIVAADRTNGIKAWTGNGLTGPAALWTDAFSGTGLPITGAYANARLGDVNNDGNLDIATSAYYSSNGVRVWLGNGGVGGTMTWTESSTGLISNRNGYVGLEMADLNDDGNLDIVAANFVGNGIKAWLGDGGAGGSMTWIEDTSGLPAGAYVDIDLGDYNNDGKVDIVASHSNGVEVWENQRPDITIAGYMSISNGLPTSLDWADVVFADVNNDGKLDIAYTRFQNGNQGLRVHLGDGTGNWVNSSNGLSVGGSYGGMRFDDLNHDGALDLVAAGVSGASDGIDVWRGDGTGSWSQQGGPTMNSGGGLEKGDLNNDGNTDISTGYYSGNLGPMVFLGNGNFGWSSDVGPSGSTMNVDDVAIGDVNNDGKLDLAASSMNSIGVQLWTGDGSATPASWVRNDTGLPTTGVYLGLAFGDVNHDGNLDLATAGFGPVRGMYVFTGNGGLGGSMAWQNSSNGFPMTGGYGGVEFCDLDLDGNLDAVFAGSWSGGSGIQVRMGNGGAGGMMLWTDPGFPGLPTTGQYWGVACGDVDNDGLLEIGATKAGGVEVWKAIPPGNIPPTVNVIVPSGTESWSGNTVHNIEWTMNDDSTPTANLQVYINYSSSSGSGTIAGPLTGLLPPFTYPWTTPAIDAIDVVVTVDAVDGDGETGSDSSSQFEIDSTRPLILGTIPSNGQVDITINTNLRADWSEGMNRVQTELSFRLMDNLTWTTVSGVISWSGNRMIFNPDSDLNPDSWYTANFTTIARDDSNPGNRLASLYSWSFRTAALADTLPPTISDVRAEPSPQEINRNVNISAVVVDDIAVGMVVVNVSSPIGDSNDSMSFDGGSGRYFLDRVYTQGGNYTFMIWAADSSGNWASSSGAFVVGDWIPPFILHTPVNTALVNNPINLTATVTDNLVLANVRLNYTDVVGTTRNVSADGWGVNQFSYDISPQQDTGTITYFFWANDTSSNVARTPTYVMVITEPRPRPPENLVVSVQGADSLLLSWTAPTTNEDGTALADLRGYNIYRSTQQGVRGARLNTVIVLSTSFLNTGLEEGRTYYYVVTAVNSRGLESSDSNEAPGTTLTGRIVNGDVTLWPLIIIIIVIVITAVIILILFLLRRRKGGGSEAPLQQEQPKHPEDKT